MSNELQRVGLVFTSEGAVDFKKTLQEINLEMNKNYNQFKLTQAQWNSSTKTTEKLKAQQEYLTNAYKIQQDKVATLKMQLSDLENAENKNTNAIKKKKNELTNAEVKLLDYQNKIKDVENKLSNSGKKIEEFGTKVEKTGGKIEKAGKKVSAFSLATGTALVASTKSAIDFESAFTGVEKTVDGTEQQMAELKQGIRNMAKEIPSSTTEIAAVAEAAGQLGIKTEDILSFTRVMIDLGNSTNLSAEEAASALAKFANITGMSANDYSKLGATIVDLGNNFATTEADIVEMATRLAATGDLAGLSQSQILALATAMSSVGIEAEAGGSAMSKLLKQIQVAVETGSSDLQDFASVAGMSSNEFKKAFEENAVKALTAFITGLNDTERNGKSAIAILDDMELTEVRLSNTILSLANASDVMTNAVDTAGKAWEENTALTNEANKRYGTLKSKIEIAVNKLKDFAITIGNKLMPSVSKIIDKIGDFAKWLENLSDEQVDFIIKIGLMVTAIGPLISLFGKITSTAGVVVKKIGIFSQALTVLKTGVDSNSMSANKLANSFKWLSSSAGIATTAFTAVTVGLSILKSQIDEEMSSIKEARNEIESNTQARQSSLDTINQELSANISQIENTKQLRNELSNLVDENGKVKEGYESRVQFILNQLNGALGTEYSLNGNLINSYKELVANIDELIEKKKAQVILEANEEKYKEAINNKNQAYEDYLSTQDKIAEVQKKINDLQDNWIGRGSADVIMRVNEYKGELEDLQTTLEEQDKQLQEYNNAITTYQQNSQLMIEGGAENYKKIEQSVAQTQTNITNIANENLTQRINDQIAANEKAKELYDLEAKYNQDAKNSIYATNVSEGQKNLQALADELVSRTSTIGALGQEEIEAWRTIGTNSFDVYKEKLDNMDPTLSAKIQTLTGIITSDTNMESAAGGQADRMTTMFGQKLALGGKTAEEIEDITEKLKNDTSVGDGAAELASDADSSFNNSVNGQKWGEDLSENIANGVKSKKSINLVSGAASAVASAIKSILGHSVPSAGPLKDELTYMPDMIDNLVKGIDANRNKVKKATSRVAQDIKNELNLEKAKDSIKSTTSMQNTSSIKEVAIDYEKMANAFLQALNSSGITSRIEDILKKILETGKNQKIVLDSGELVGATASLIDTELNNIKSREERGS